MATPQLSPGILVREVDLTVGRADNVLDNIGAIASPFAIGPIDEPIDITTENELINVFGKPFSTDAQYEYWMSASSYLSYGGVLKVVRTDGAELVNANAIRNSAGISTAGEPTLKIKNFDDYEANYSDDIANYIFAAKNPGSWANNLKVCVIDDKADQILNVGAASTFAQVGFGITTTLTSVPSAGIGTTSVFSGYLKGIITGVDTNTVDVKITSVVSTDGTETPITYAQRNQLTSFRPTNTVNIIDNTGELLDTATIGSGANAVLDWYDQQSLNLTNTSILWRSIAPKPGTSQYAEERQGKSDEIHVVVIDDTGSVTGIQGNLLEKHIGLSKSSDAVSAVNSPQKIWWKNYIAQFSNTLYVGDDPSDNANPNEPVVPTGFWEDFTPFTDRRRSLE
jgi:hypothetical protein